jgi:hypothetical protein
MLRYTKSIFCSLVVALSSSTWGRGVMYSIMSYACEDTETMRLGLCCCCLRRLLVLEAAISQEVPTSSSSTVEWLMQDHRFLKHG